MGCEHLDQHGCFNAPRLDVAGYVEAIERCRSEFPQLRILTGLEIGEPHWFADETDALLSSGHFDRVLGSLHSTTIDAQPRLIDEWYAQVTTAEQDAEAIRGYLAEAIELVQRSSVFEVFAHIDYLTRQYAEGGAAVSFGSDAHDGPSVGRGFVEAAAMAESAGFRPQADPLDFWRR